MSSLSSARSRDAAADANTSPRATDVPAFNAKEFHDLSEMIGDDGVMEMVMIFETETRQRLHRVAAGNQPSLTLVREMHTLKGAAGTVAAPYLTALGRRLERAAHRGIGPTRDDIKTIEAALETWLAAVPIWHADHVPVG